MIFFLVFASGTEQKWNRPEHGRQVLNINEDGAYDNPSSSLLVNGSESDHIPNGVVKSWFLKQYHFNKLNFVFNIKFYITFFILLQYFIVIL